MLKFKFNGKNFSSLNNLNGKERGELAKLINNEIALFYETNQVHLVSIFDLLQYLYDVLIECTIEYYDNDLDIVELCLDEETCLKVCNIILKKYTKTL